MQSQLIKTYQFAQLSYFTQSIQTLDAVVAGGGIVVIAVVGDDKRQDLEFDRLC